MNILIVQVLRALHITAGAFWFGAAVLNAGFLGPALREIGPAGGQLMRHMVQVRKLPVFMNGAAVTAVVTGIILYGWRSSWFQSTWMHSGSGMIFGTGGALAILALIFGYTFVGRRAARMGQLMAGMQGQGGPPSPEVAAEIGQLQQGMARAAGVITVMIGLATLAMAVGRYV